MKKGLLGLGLAFAILVPMFLFAPKTASAGFYSPDTEVCYTGTGRGIDCVEGIILYVPEWYATLLEGAKRASTCFRSHCEYIRGFQTCTAFDDNK